VGFIKKALSKIYLGVIHKNDIKNVSISKRVFHVLSNRKIARNVILARVRCINFDISVY